ncbi:peroxidase family protein [Actinocrispum wychmicini]|uniref:Secreted protein n=1 Tax=Actinocrispum wychmicini TaxID=1213861 RepID=A0A4R2J5N8_9PSEU|nr:heme peroxidase family protein [Actinocrispum wychmicini]TCO54203.1 secreted protein [Actinocrispum wychmicini]
MPPAEKDRHHLSRRGFLGGVTAAGAATAVSAFPGAALADPLAATSPLFFGRVFQLPPFATASPALQDAMREIGKPGGLMDAADPLQEGPVRLITNPELSPNNRDNPFHTAGTTFFGQFIDHDFTFDQTSTLGVPTPPETTRNTRNPTLNLDTVYGGGPVGSPELYDTADPAKFRVESGGQFEDLPRRADGVAIIADPRNDENLMIAGLHSAFLLFHNKVVNFVRAQGTPSAQVFAEARRLVTWHYQWIILNDFLPQIITFGIVQDILNRGRKFYRPPAGQQFMPVEFQGAVYRFGHSMVRPSYRANLAGDAGKPFFGFIFDPAGLGQADPVDLRGRARAPRRFIGWQTFFDFRGNQVTAVRPNKRIDTHISTPLFNLPLAAIPSGDAPTALPQRNLLRHITWSIPSGQALAAAMGQPPLGPEVFPELRQFNLGLDSNTPLWYYILREADVINDGIALAGVGARLCGEVFIGLLQLDPTSYLSVNPNFRPTLPGRTAGEFHITDLLTFAGVDPASRGQ